MRDNMADLCLGTVQFGMKYGVNNFSGQPLLKDSFEMLDIAIKNGITTIDTARAYGTAEIILGQYFENRKNQDKVKVISKLCPNVVEADEKDIYSIIRRELEESLKRIRVSKLDGYLLHTPEYVHNPEIVSALVRLKQEGLVEHIGVSIYEIGDGYTAIDTGCVDYIQLPYSILDQRGMKENFIPKAKEMGITIFARSVFLQGLFFMEKARIPQHLKDAVSYITTFERLLSEYQVDRVTALMQFVMWEKNIDYLVFGVDTKEQLLEDINRSQDSHVPKEFIDAVKNSFDEIEKSIIFPSLWSNGKKVK